MQAEMYSCIKGHASPRFHQALGSARTKGWVAYRRFFTSRTATTVQVLWLDDLVSVARFIADCFDCFQSGGHPHIQP